MKTIKFPTVNVVTDQSVLDFITQIVSKNEQEEPFFIGDLSDIVYKYKMFKLKMPRVEPFYAVKCNENSTVLSLLAALGTGFDCASKVEIQSVLDLGVSPSRIVYANPCKSKGYIRHAAKVGVDMMTFDNELELYKTKSLYPDAKLIIRIRVDDSGSAWPLGLKFGCNLEDVPHLLQTAKDLDLNVIGVSFHVGSNCKDATAYRAAIATSHEVFQIAQEIGHDMNLLDIGGGFPDSKLYAQAFLKIALTINDAIDEYFPEESGVRIIAEPGRYFVTSAFTLCVNIIAKRETLNEDGEPINMYYMNDGIYGSFNCLFFDEVELVAKPLVDSENRTMMKSRLWGPTCDSLDCVMKSCTLPAMDIGEWFMFENMGAYTICTSSTFNGFMKPEIKWVLPVHALTYLQQLPAWNQLQQTLGVKPKGIPDAYRGTLITVDA